MKLVEVQPFSFNVVERSKRDGVLMTLEGVIQRADTKNANGRIYPRSLWNDIMKDVDVNERISTRRMVGELDHPAKGSTSLDRISHVITEQQMLPNGEIRGKMDILDTPAGRIAERLFAAGVQLGISSRGDGSVEQKGDHSEVQNDYRLETYDLVLKPSTPGAYPQICESEEEASKNLELIANAVEGLVENSDDVGVLLECHNIISVLEGCDERCEMIQSKLTERLKLDTPPDGDPDGGQGNSENETVTGEANEMSGNIDKKDLSPELSALIKEHADAIVNERLGKKDEEINRLNSMIVSMTQEKEEIEEQLTAAKSLIEEFQRKVEDLTENQSTDEELQTKFKAACEIIDESVSRLQEMGEIKRRYEAAKSLLAASIDRHKEEAIADTIGELLADIDESVSEKLRPILESCNSPDEVTARFEELSGLVQSIKESAPVTREPLPTQKPINESKSTDTVHKTGDVIMDGLMARMAGNIQ